MGFLKGDLPNKATEEAKANEVALFVLLDSSGSMYSKWEDSIDSINAFVNNLKTDSVGPVVINTFDRTVTETSLEDYIDLTSKGLTCAGFTPLYDSAMKILLRAEEVNSEKTVIVIVTDGQENGSTKYNLSQTKDKIGEFEARGWEVVFLGAEFDAVQMAMDFGLDATKVINTSDARGRMEAMATYASATRSYMMGQAINTQSAHLWNGPVNADGSVAPITSSNATANKTVDK